MDGNSGLVRLSIIVVISEKEITIRLVLYYCPQDLAFQFRLIVTIMMIVSII